MSAFIKLSTLEYPRHVGDIAIDPVGPHDFEPVAWVDKPAHDPEKQDCLEGAPVQQDGQWVMTWVVTDLTPEEIQDRKDRIAALFASKGIPQP